MRVELKNGPAATEYTYQEMLNRSGVYDCKYSDGNIYQMISYGNGRDFIFVPKSGPIQIGSSDSWKNRTFARSKVSVVISDKD